MKNNEYLSSTQACKELDICKKTLLAWHDSGRLVPEFTHPHTKYRKYSREQIDKFKEKKKNMYESEEEFNKAVAPIKEVIKKHGKSNMSPEEFSKLITEAAGKSEAIKKETAKLVDEIKQLLVDKIKK